MQQEEDILSEPCALADTGEHDAWQFPGVIGEELARCTRPALGILERLRQTRALSRSDTDELIAAVEKVQRVAMAAQQITRLKRGGLRQSHERLNLATVLRDVIAANDYGYLRRGVEIEQRLQDIEVIADPGLLVSLCEAAIQCAARAGGRIQVWLKMRNWPQQAQLTLRSRPHVGLLEDGVEPPTCLEWLYLQRLADATAAQTRREITGGFLETSIEFTRTVTQMEGLTALDVEGAHAPDARPYSGHRMLLVASDPEIRWEVEAACREMRVELDVVPSCAKAIRFCELDFPELIVYDDQLHDEKFDELLADVGRQDINFPVVEIIRTPNVVELSAWPGGSRSRISKGELRAHFRAVLTMELAKLF